MKKICYKFLSIILCIMLSVSCMPLTVFAEEEYDGYLNFIKEDASISATNGICSWSYDSTTKTVYVDGEFLDSYTSDDGGDLALPIYRETESGEREYCYRYFEHIVFSNMVEGIYSYCDREFFPSLKTVEFEEGSALRTIGASAFENSTLESITLPATLLVINNNAFAYSNIKQITIPASVKQIGSYAFSDSQLSEIRFEERKTRNIRFGDGVFAGTQLTSFDFNEVPIDADYVPVEFFDQCKNLESVTLNGTDVIIGRSAFRACPSLCEFDFSNVIEVSENAFSSSGITTVSGEKVVDVGEGAFSYCKNLTTINLPLVNYVNHKQFLECTALSEFNFTDIAEVGDKAFMGTAIESVENDCMEYIGANAFASCESLKTVNLPFASEVGGYAFSDCVALESCNLGRITVVDNFTFFNTTSLKSFDFSKIEQVLSHSFANSGLTNVNLPKVTTIGVNAFENVQELKSVTLGSQLENISSMAFYNCSNAKFNALPKSIKKVGDLAFSGTGIESASIYEACTYGSGVFMDCRALTDVSLESTVAYIKKEMFKGCSSLESISLPKNLAAIEANAFQGCSSLNEIFVPTYTTKVADLAFADCPSLERVIFAKYYFSAGKDIFLNSNPVIYGATYSTAEQYALDNSLTFKAKGSGDLSAEIEDLIQDDDMDSEETYGTWQNGTWKYSADRSTLYIFGEGVLNSKSILDAAGRAYNSFNVVINNCDYSTVRIVIGEGITSIPSQTFRYTKEIVSVVLPNSLETIDYRGFYNAWIDTVEFGSGLKEIGAEAFQGCKITRLVFPEDSVLEKIGNDAFRDNCLTEFNFPATVTYFGKSVVSGSVFSEIDLSRFRYDTVYGDYMFQNSTITSIDLSNVKNISNGMFYGCTNLTSVTIPNSVKSINSGAFQRCTALTDVKLGDTITSIPADCFYLCTSLKNINTRYVTSIGDRAFYGCTGLEYANLFYVKTMGTQAFCLSGLTRVSLYNLQIINTEAFRECKELKEVTSLRAIETRDRAFYGCTKLESIDIDTAEKIGYEAYANTGIKELTLWGGNIAMRAFAGSALESVMIEYTTTTLPGEIFKSCHNLKTVTISSNSKLTTIGRNAFESSGIENIALPASLTTIGEYAFANCNKLKNIIIPNQVSSIGNYAFSDCTAMKYAVITRFGINMGASIFKSMPNLTIIGERLSSAYEYSQSRLIEFEVCNGYEYFDLHPDEFAYAQSYKDNEAYAIDEVNTSMFGTWENGTWQYSSTGSKLYFVGSGTLSDTMETSDGLRVRFDDIIRMGKGNISVHIGGGITEIGDDFASCDESVYISYLYIEAGVETVGNNAFCGVKITNLNIGSDLRSIGDNAFNNSQISSLYIDSTATKLESVGDYSFANNNFGAGAFGMRYLKNIGAHAFENNNFTDFDGTDRDVVIGDYAFANNRMKTITISLSNTLGEYVFVNNAPIKTTVTLPEGMTEIPNGLFSGCTTISTIAIPDSVKIIGDEAFKGISISKIEFSENVEYIGSGAFTNCLYLRDVVFNSDSTEIYTDTVNKSKSAIGYDENSKIISSVVIYSTSRSTALAYAVDMNIPFFATDCNSDVTGYITNRPGVINPDECVQWSYFNNVDILYIFGKGPMIGDFYDMEFNPLDSVPKAKKIIIVSGVNSLYTPLCEVGASEIILPETIRVIENSFKNCVELESLVVPDNVSTIYPSAFEGCKSLKTLSLGKGLKVVPERMAENCVSLKYLNMEGVQIIKDSAFKNCSALQSLKFPDTTTIIGQGAFLNCYNVFNISFGKNLISISTMAFANLYMLDTVTFTGDVGSIDINAFNGSGSMTLGIDIILGDDVERSTLSGFKNVNVKSVYLGDSFYGFDNYFEMPTLKEYRLSENNDTGIYEYKGCLYRDGVLLNVPQGAESIEIKSDTVAIGADAFRCSNINTIRIPSTVSIIGENAFAMAPNLKSVRIQSGVEAIGDSAFEGCEKLKTINIPYPCVSIGSKAFKGCKNLASVLLPEGILSIGSDCFSGCVLEGIVLPKSLVELGAGALSYIPTLKSVYVWNPTIGYKVFNQSSIPTIYTMAGTFAHGYARSNNVPFNVYTDEEVFTEICFDAIDILSGYLGYCTDGHGDIEWLTVYEGSCDHDGYEIGVCEYCSEILEERRSEAQGHKYCQVAYIKETATDYGIRVLKCSVCSQYLKTYYEPLDEYKPSIGVYTVSGKIEADNGKAYNFEDTSLENADIYIDGTLVASTDENGHFRFKMKSGNYIMEIRYAYGFTRFVGLSITDHDIILTDKQAIKLVACDFNKDGVINAADQELFMLVIFSKKGDVSYLKFVDLNNDGCINAKDYVIVEKMIGSNFLTYMYPELTLS